MPARFLINILSEVALTDTNPTPALLVDWLTPVYDVFAKLFFPEAKFKRALIAYASLAADQHVLDLGAGTGTLAIMIKQAQPDVRVTGLDGDPDILSIAREKASRADVNITFDHGNAAALPYPDASFDRVLSSLVFSLLSSDVKRDAVHESYRVLRGGGALLIADFGPPHTWWGRRVAPLMRRWEPLHDHLEGRLPEMFREAGLEYVETLARFATVFGTLSILVGRKPN
jgi:ubiquinone/menaquinone biosynthesis C-methylase UbiE